MNTRGMNGFDAYENAWDVMAEHLWNLLLYNLAWFAGAAGVFLAILLLTVGEFNSWFAFFILVIFVFLVLSPLWEAGNIVRYAIALPSHAKSVPFVKIVLARLLFLAVVTPAYLFFVLPGIYIHCRLSLYLPLLVFSPDISVTRSLSKSWSLTQSRFVDLYTLWIAVVVSKPVCLLPFGLGFLLERPASGLAKAFMLTSCSNRQRVCTP